MRISKEGDDRLTAAVFQNEVTCMVAEHSHQKTMKTTGRLSFSLKKNWNRKTCENDRPIVVLINKKKIRNEKPVRTTGRLIVFFFVLLNINIEIAEGSENARPLSNILYFILKWKSSKKAERSHSPHVYAVRTNAECRLADWQVNIVVAFYVTFINFSLALVVSC